MFQFWNYENFMTLIHSFLFDFRKKEIKISEKNFDLMNNILDF